ncbi:MAG: DUF4827 domain-containing protein [Paramuribaculum sp.]|nr:DUF4827 domain-containing protein [Paramuribaculum sp.]
MKILNRIPLLAIAVVTALSTVGTACDDDKSYAELLEEENKAVNLYLSDQKIETTLPEDNNFITGEDAPYYRLDNDGNVFMQVVKKGDGEMAKSDQLIYFRFMRYNLTSYDGVNAMPGEGNSDYVEGGNMSFRYQNFKLESSSAWGMAIQMPLEYLPINSEVRLVVKSQYGWTSEISSVQPYLYHLRYYKSQI